MGAVLQLVNLGLRNVARLAAFCQNAVKTPDLDQDCTASHDYASNARA